MLKKYKVLIKIFLITVTLFLVLDSTVGKYVYKKYIRAQLKDINTDVSAEDEFYDHKYKKNYVGIGGWGNLRYNLCSDNNGFRISCNKKDKNLKSFDIAFIGDSFTEGIGIEYEKTFVGIIEEELNDRKVINLAMSSYSASIYYTKINKLINDGFKFNEIVVFVDLSDLADDILCYKVIDKKIQRKATFKKCYNNFNKKNNNFLNFYEKNFKISKILVDRILRLFFKENFAEARLKDVFENSRSEWTYKYNKSIYNNLEFEKAKNISISHMNNLYKLLKKNSIKLSIAVYPWPGTLKYDKVDNEQVRLWKNFCKDKCNKFYNLMPIFFKDNYKESYDKFYIKDDVHFNELGNKILAKNFLDLYKN